MCIASWDEEDKRMHSTVVYFLFLKYRINSKGTICYCRIKLSADTKMVGVALCNFWPKDLAQKFSCKLLALLYMQKFMYICPKEKWDRDPIAIIRVCSFRR